MEDKMELNTLATITPISDVQVLKKVLEANIKLNGEEIIKLAFSTKAQDNYQRLTLIAQRDLALNLLSRID